MNRTPRLAALLLLAASLAAVPAAAVEVRVSLLAQRSPAIEDGTGGDGGGGFPVEVTARPVGEVGAITGGEEEHEPVTVRGRVPGSVRLDLPAGTAWALSARAEGFWAAAETLLVEPAGAAASMQLWPTGTVSGSIALLRQETPPREMTVRFEPAADEVIRRQREATRHSQGSPQTDDGPGGEVRCPVQELTFRCEVPAGTHDLRVAAPTFVSHYRFGVRVPARGETQLGLLPLRRGASVVGWVAAEGGGPSRSARVSLTPQAAVVAPGTDAQRFQQLTQQTGLQQRGFFQFRGVAPGRYRIVAEDDGYPPAVRNGVDVRADHEVVLEEPLLLERPRPVTVVIDPAVGPGGDPWNVTVEAIDTAAAEDGPVVEEPAGEDGRLVASLPRGTYGLYLRTRGLETWHAEVFSVQGKPRTVRVTAPVVPVTGSVRLGEEPLPARLKFMSRMNVVALTMESDEEGEYSGVLSGEGTWKVELASDEPPLERVFYDVRVEEGPDGGPARVDFELPDTRVSGQVVDRTGTPVHRAIVAASAYEGDGESIRRRVEDPEGRFEIRGMPEGTLLLRAEAGERTSERVSVVLEDGREPAPVHLVVRDRLRVSGKVVTGDGAGIPGAVVQPRGLSQLHFWVPRETTAADGSFTLELPPGETDVLLTVYAPGFALRTFRLPVRPEEELIVPLLPGGGVLSLRLETPETEVGNPSLGLYLLHGGSFLGLGTLRSWAAVSGEPTLDPAHVRAPAMEPGDYHLCRVSQPELATALLTGSPPSEDACTGGFLTAGGVLELEAP